MPDPSHLALACALCLSAQGVALAADAPVTAEAPAAAAPVTADAPAPAPAPDAPAAAPAPQSRWEGAIGPILAYGPSYQGSPTNRMKVTPGFFVRYGRLTVTNTGGFVTRRADEVQRGLELDLSRGDRWRINLGLRYDRGRDEGSAPELAGLGDIDPTLRVRLNASWRLDGHWRVNGNWSVDAFGRGGGNLGEVGVQYHHALTKETSWSWGTTLVLAGDRYLQSYFGINQAQSEATGYPVYTPRAGLRDLSTSLGFRTELSRDWVWIGSASISQLLDGAAASPLTKKLTGWGLNSGIAWRF